MFEAFKPKIEEREPFVLDERLLKEYPEMKKISGLFPGTEPSETYTISAIYSNGNAIDSYIKDVEGGEQSGNIEYHLKIIAEGLQKLSEMNNPEYIKFIEKENKKLEERKEKAQKAIGNKKRGEDGIYR